MKVKTVKQSVSLLLVVADPKINALYECDKDEPIQLARLCNPFSMGAYEVEDWRLSEFASIGPYNPPSGNSFHTPKNEEERIKLISLLHNYEERKGDILWDTFDTMCFDGDNPERIEKYGGGTGRLTARFTYKGAKERFDEIREFWENWDNPDLEKARIVNPHRQISREEVMMWQFVNKKATKKQKP